MSILYEKHSTQSLDAVGRRLEEAVKAHKFGVITVIDLKSKMAEKGVDLQNPCRVYEVCNPMQAKRALEKNMTISTALPCRISLYQEKNQVKLATILPTAILGLFSSSDLMPVAQEVETTIKAIMDDATKP